METKINKANAKANEDSTVTAPPVYDSFQFFSLKQYDNENRLLLLHPWINGNTGQLF